MAMMRSMGLALVTALVAGCAARTAAPRPAGEVLAEMRTARVALERYSRECFQAGWGAPAEYGSLTRRQALQEVETLLDTHARQLAAWTRCTREIRPKLEAYREAVQAAKTAIRGTSVPADKAARLAALLDQSYESLARFVDESYPTIVALERAYIAFFTRLEAERPHDDAPLVFPEEIERGERRVSRLSGEQAVSVARYFEGFYLLAPTPEIRTRMNAARVLATVHRSINHLLEADEQPPAQRVQAFRRELLEAQRLVAGEIGDTTFAAAKPATVARYRAMLAHLRRVDRTLTDLEALYRRPSVPAAREEGLLASLQADLDQVEQLAHVIDAEP